MAENFYTILTSTGKAKLANSAVLGSKVNFKTLKVGDGKGAYYEPSENQTSLVNQVWSGNISSISVDENNPNWIVIETLIPATIGGFFIREAGIFDEDDELIAISKLSETYKPVVSEGSIKDLCIKIILEVSNVESVTLKIDPTVIVATRKDVDVLQGKIQEIHIKISDINTKMLDMDKNKAKQSDLDITNDNLGKKANDTDNSRTTSSKTVTGAINELNFNKANKDGTLQTGLNADMLGGVHASTFMRVTNANGFYGLTTPDGDANNWIRTSVNGLIPYQSGGASCLGTSSWPFSAIYGNTVFSGGYQVYHQGNVGIGTSAPGWFIGEGNQYQVYV